MTRIVQTPLRRLEVTRSVVSAGYEARCGLWEYPHFPATRTLGYGKNTPKQAPEAGKRVNLIRYADDFIITGASQEILEKEIKPLVEAFLRECGLELSPEKTHISHITDGFDFLGQNTRDYNSTVLCKPSQKNIKTFLAHIREVIKDNAQATAGHLIAILNPKIRGWTAYHQHASSKKTLVKIDHAILWRYGNGQSGDILTKATDGLRINISYPKEPGIGSSLGARRTSRENLPCPAALGHG